MMRIMALFIALLFTLTASAEPRIYYVHNDHNGAPLMMTDQNQHVVWKANYAPFGKAIIEVEEVELPVRYKGQYYDKESGLHYNYFRDYNPNTGRYVQSDPIGLAGGLNTYAYVNGNPVNYVDSFGLDSFLASRPTAGGVARHMFIVYGANADGAGGTVRSFGSTNNGDLGEVDNFTVGFSEGTLRKDREYWKSKKEGLIYSPIPASDEDVACAANNIASQWRYTFPGGYLGRLTMNSNTAAQAIAEHAAKQRLKTPEGWHPGAENSGLIRFE